MGLSIFKISILLIIIGASGTGIIFSEADRSSQLMSLKQTESEQISIFFEENDIGYFTITNPEFQGQGVYFRIVDENFDTISKGIAETKMSIRYFDVKESGIYTIVLTNLAQEKMNKLSWGQRMWMGAQDAEWRKFEAAHKRAHMRALDHKGYKVKKPTKTHRVLSYVVVGGISFWIGHEYAKKSHHKGHNKKRPYGWETRGDKK